MSIRNYFLLLMSTPTSYASALQKAKSACTGLSVLAAFMAIAQLTVNGSAAGAAPWLLASALSVVVRVALTPAGTAQILRLFGADAKGGAK